MKTFSNELKKIMARGSVLMDQRSVGRFLYGWVEEGLRAKLEFVELTTYHQYAGIKMTVFSVHNGVIDSAFINMFDILGRKAVGDRVYKAGVHPYIEEMDGKAQWHVFTPSEDDYQKLYEEVEKYLSIF